MLARLREVKDAGAKGNDTLPLILFPCVIKLPIQFFSDDLIITQEST